MKLHMNTSIGVIYFFEEVSYEVWKKKKKKKKVKKKKIKKNYK